MDFPYVFISCPCKDVSVPVEKKDVALARSNVASERREMSKDKAEEKGQGQEEEDEDLRTFEPRSLRASYSLFPPDHLLFCEECQQIRCERCIVEEIVCWYCPGCLFEMPLSMVKSEGGRCTRNCYNCPVCTSLLQVSSIPKPKEIDEAEFSSKYMLSCSYCKWNSQHLGWVFEKPVGIYNQLNQMKAARRKERLHNAENVKSSSSPGAEAKSQDPSDKSTSFNKNPDIEAKTDHSVDARFEYDQIYDNLFSFYTSQHSVGDLADPMNSPMSVNYQSPSSLSRIMNLYSGRDASSNTEKGASAPLREAVDASEGLQVLNPDHERKSLMAFRAADPSELASREQQARQPYPIKYVRDLQPLRSFLRTKRSKRCKTCRHILVKPETKVQSTRFKIKLIALNHIPAVSISPLHLSTASSSETGLWSLNAIPSWRPLQVVMTFKNPMFEAVRVTLATPDMTPGRHAHKVTILSPDFEIGANVDQWDEALLPASSGVTGRPALSASTSFTRPGDLAATGDHARIPEAGKVWGKGHNWTSIVLEIICSSGDEELRGQDMDDDDDVLEIPMFLRLQWECDPVAEGSLSTPLTSSDTKEEIRERRELSYWTVLGIGKVAELTKCMAR